MIRFGHTEAESQSLCSDSTFFIGVAIVKEIPCSKENTKVNKNGSVLKDFTFLETASDMQQITNINRK